MTTMPPPISVLVADDDLFAQRLTITMLRQLGHSGVVVADGMRALDVLSQRPFDLLLLDVAMPGVDGLAVLTAVRAAEVVDTPAPRQRVLMMTAYAERDAERRLLEAGADGVIFKPFNPAQFSERLRRVLAEAPAPALPQSEETP